MNDADLEKLAIKPGKLEPVFNRNVTNYSTTLPSTVTKINVNPITRDVDASWTVVGHGCVRTLPVKPGEERTIVIEVTAEDGSTKKYFIHITSLSPSAVVLSDIKLSIGTLTPAFLNGTYEYTVEVPWHVDKINVLPVANDKDTGGANTPIIVDLDYGSTICEFDISSPDKSRSKTFKIEINKEKILRTINAVNRDLNIRLSCPLCLGVLLCPVLLRSHHTSKTKILYCRACIETIIRTRKTDPFDETPLKVDCIEVEDSHVKDLSSVPVSCCYSFAGCADECRLKDLGFHMKQCTQRPVFASKFEGVIDKRLPQDDIKLDTEPCKMCSHAVRRDEVPTHLKLYCPAKIANTKINHVVELRNWERKLQEKGAYENTEGTSEEIPRNAKGILAFEELETAAARYAALIKLKPRDYVNHMKLGLVFEEMYYATDIWGNTPESKGGDEDEDKTLDNLMDMASDSSKEDDINALCEAKGVPKNAPLSSKLKAIDEEYHSLLEQHQSAKADYVQKLYVWKSKQSVETTKLGASASEDSYLGKAFLKFQDACACSPNNWVVHMHVGRHLLMQRNYEGAIQRLEAAFGLKPISIEARFYLGLAYMKHFGKTDKQHNETLKYLQDGVDYILLKLFENLEADLPFCSAEIFVRNSNLLLVEGMLQLANLLKEKSGTCERDRLKIIGMYKQTSIVCFHFINSMKHRNEIYCQLLWVILRVHFSLGMFMTAELKKQTDIPLKDKQYMQIYWERLASLGKAFELPMDSRTLNIQRKICEEAASLCPSSSQSLFRLGDIQLLIYDQDPKANAEFLREAEYSYRASIEFEGRPAYSSEHSMLSTECDWWKQRHGKEEGNHQKQQVKLPVASTARKQVKGPVVASRGATKPNNPSTTKPSPAPASKGTTASRKITTTPAKSSAPASKGTAAASKGSASPAKSVTAVSKSTSPSKSNTLSSKSPTGAFKGTTPATKISTTSTLKKATSSVKSQQSLRKTSDSPVVKKSDTKLTKSHDSGKCSAAKPPQQKEPGKAPIKPPPKPVEKVATNNPETPILNKTNYQARLGLARVLSHASSNVNNTEIIQLYSKVIELAPHIHDAYIELGARLAKTDPLKAVVVYNKFPFQAELSFDDAYLHGEILRLLMKAGNYDDPVLERSMIAYATVMGLNVLDKQVSELENKFKYKLLRNVYAGVNKKSVDDEDLQDFFKFKCWV